MPQSQAESLARRVIARLRSAGHQAWLVGGCVRDLLLGASPKDFDISTDARPDRIMDLFPHSGLVGAHFGVVLVRDAFAQVEVATFRSDHEYEDGRRPTSVHFETDPKADVLRRDFTINGLMMDVGQAPRFSGPMRISPANLAVPDPAEGRVGNVGQALSPANSPANFTVLDYVGGRADLDARLIRAIGDPDARFREDHLRLLRAVRFAARLGFTIEQATFAAIRRHAALIARVSAERVRDELVRILTEGGAAYGLDLLDQSGLLATLLPEIAAMHGVEQPPEYHPEGDVWTHTRLLLERLGRATPTLALGALLHDVGKPPVFRVADRIRFDGHVEKGVEMSRAILARLRFSRDDAAQVESLVAHHMHFKDVGRMKESTLKRLMRLPRFDEHLELHRLDCLASSGHLENYDLVKRKFEEMSAADEIKPAPLITGADLIAAGYRPGPRFGEILSAVEDAQLEHRLSTPAEALEWVLGEWPLEDGKSGR
ncbi:MAG: CCA tRNA nucleotidyltransferase [Bryobacteraceae bacterium]|jgi:poly(A) polymerase